MDEIPDSHTTSLSLETLLYKALLASSHTKHGGGRDHSISLPRGEVWEDLPVKWLIRVAHTHTGDT